MVPGLLVSRPSWVHSPRLCASGSVAVSPPPPAECLAELSATSTGVSGAVSHWSFDDSMLRVLGSLNVNRVTRRFISPLLVQQ